ncbi:hypothetical protein C8R44DRAFT_751646 [Mycena epipterygia]|nr:hypothetical protein C8R44DRAFT_751646 [Mycena epipterygia]
MAKLITAFLSMIGRCLESERTTAAEFLQAVEQIRAEFPEVRPWLAWWILPGNGSMIFPAMQKMPAELRAKLPNSTNGTKPQPKSRITWHENDGRAPDTRERLAAIEKIEGDFTARNSALTDAERFNACNSAPVFPGAPPAPAPSYTPPTMLMRQSYIWDANSCFKDAPIEAYFRIFIAMGGAFRAEFGDAFAWTLEIQACTICLKICGSMDFSAVQSSPPIQL